MSKTEDTNRIASQKGDRVDHIATKDLLERFSVIPGRKVALKDFDPGYVPPGVSKQQAEELLRESVERLSTYQDMLYAQNTYSLLVILQAMDAAGKDGVIKHVMTGLNPQGCQVYSFKAPSAEELDHDYLWRTSKALPERGRIGIFNRSYYEEALVVRVHPEILEGQHLPPKRKGKKIWKQRFEDMNNFEQYLVNNGIEVVKIFLNVSKEEQRKRFLARIDEPSKNWKFSTADAKERTHWDEYMEAFEDVFTHTSTESAPWYIVPADNKWFTRLAVARILYSRMKSLDLAYPVIDAAQRGELMKAREVLERE
ncbi:MAG: polyphosphate kinase 2 family protein [Bryobacteraceae bacterium]|nr:polyphosphate kinase 2 family protein [Bryobacteraceae bacterium]